MKTLIVALLFTVAISSVAAAQDIPPAPSVPAELDVSGVTGLISDKMKEVKGAVLVTLGGKPGAAGYLPIWTWQTKDGTPIMEFPTIGYRAVQGARPDAFTTTTLNLPGLSAKLFGGQWFREHVKKSPFPPVFFGPALIIPMDLKTVQTLKLSSWQQYAAVVLSVRLAPKALAGTK